MCTHILKTNVGLQEDRKPHISHTKYLYIFPRKKQWFIGKNNLNSKTD